MTSEKVSYFEMTLVKDISSSYAQANYEEIGNDLAHLGAICIDEVIEFTPI